MEAGQRSRLNVARWNGGAHTPTLDYHANSKAIQLTDGRLWSGKPTHVEVTADHAYMIYPATFFDAENGKPVVYRGAWTMTLQKASGHWAVTGSGSAWTGH